VNQYWDILDSNTRDVLLNLRDAGLLKGFYLAGGTALVLSLGHRISVDLDLFTSKPAQTIDSNSLVQRCIDQFGERNVQIDLNISDQLWLKLDRVEVMYLAYPYRHKYPLITSDGVNLADVRDIALHKALALGRRNAARDYIDIDYILRSEITTLSQIVSDAGEVFNGKGEQTFSPRLFLQQLAYTDDLNDIESALHLVRMPDAFSDIAARLARAAQTTFSELVRPNHPDVEPSRPFTKNIHPDL